MSTKRLATWAFLLSAIFAVPHEASCGSPYSANGIGSIVPDDYGSARSMGGAGTASVGSLINGNPALLGTFPSQVYSVGATWSSTKTYLGGASQPEYAKTNPDHLKFILPIAKGIVLGWGLTPYSRTDIRIELPRTEGSPYQDKLDSSGGINVSNLGLAGTYRNRLFYGVAMNYHFGTIEERWSRSFPDTDELHSTTDYLRKKYKGYSFAFGVIVNPYKETYLGFGYTSQSDLRLNALVSAGSIGDPETPVLNRDVKLPATFRVGVTSVLNNHLIAACDYSFEQWENAAETDKEKEMYADVRRFGVGLRYIPLTRQFAPYYLTLPITVGFKYGNMYYKSYPEVDSVNEKALTFGLEVPLFNNLGSLKSSLEYGVRGDKDKNGWDETYMSFGISLSGVIR